MSKKPVTIGEAIERRRIDKALAITAAIVAPLGIKRISGTLFEFGGMLMQAFEVAGRRDINKPIVYDGWFYFQTSPSTAADNLPCPLVVRWIKGRYELVWEPAVLLFDADEVTHDWREATTGRLPL